MSEARPADGTDLGSSLFRAFSARPRPAAERILRPEANLHDAARLRELLASRTPTTLSDHELRTVVEGHLWALAPEAFVYFLPAFLRAALTSYASVSVFASELIGALTPPVRSDVVAAIDGLAAHPPGLGLPDDMTALLRAQQLEWFDSGVPTALFRERFDGLTDAEGAAVLAFLEAFQRRHGENFPFEELETAIDRHWSCYRTA